MGQQQLLLIVLGVIIVGVAVILGIQYFSVGAEEAAKDEMVAHTLTIGANAQQWYKKPEAMGGGGYSFTGGPAGGFQTYFRNVLTKLQSTTNGTYDISGQTDSTVTILGTPLPALGYTFVSVTTTVTPSTMNTVVQ